VGNLIENVINKSMDKILEEERINLYRYRKEKHICYNRYYEWAINVSWQGNLFRHTDIGTIIGIVDIRTALSDILGSNDKYIQIPVDNPYSHNGGYELYYDSKKTCEEVIDYIKDCLYWKELNGHQKTANLTYKAEFIRGEIMDE
jgi:hypothetical protein